AGWPGPTLGSIRRSTAAAAGITSELPSEPRAASRPHAEYTPSAPTIRFHSGAPLPTSSGSDASTAVTPPPTSEVTISRPAVSTPSVVRKSRAAPAGSGWAVPSSGQPANDELVPSPSSPPLSGTGWSRPSSVHSHGSTVGSL